MTPNDCGSAPPRGSKILEPQPWSTTTQPAAQPVATARRQLDLADGGEDPHPVAVGDAEGGRVLGVDQHVVALARRVQSGQLVEPRVHRVPVAPVAQLERIALRRNGSRRGQQFAGPGDELRRRGVDPLVVGAQRVPEVPELARTEHHAVRVADQVAPLQPAAVELSRHARSSSRSSQCGPNARPGRRVSRRHPPGGLDEAVEPLGAEQRLAHGDREVDEDPPLLPAPPAAARRPSRRTGRTARRACCW